MWCNTSVLIDCGVDWFTTSSLDDPTSTLLCLKADSLLRQEERKGFYVKPWRMAGYHGYRCGRVEMGMRSDGACVRLSSDLAASYWWDLYQITGRCSRIDVQATLRCEGAVNDEISAMNDMAHSFFAERQGGPKITWWGNSEGGSTLYLGARQSSWYFRAYNKEAESGEDVWARCVRVELEIKNRMCESAIAYMLSQDTVQVGLLSLLQDHMTNRGIVTKLTPAVPHSFYECPRIVTDERQSLSWLRSAVRPTVQRLLDRGLVHEVMDGLGLHYPPNENLDHPGSE